MDLTSLCPRQGTRGEAQPQAENVPRQQEGAIKRRDQGEPVTDIARSYNVHHSTISRRAS